MDGTIGKDGEIVLPDRLLSQLKLSPGSRYVVEALDGESFIVRKVEANTKKVFVELTTRCNFNCITCMRNSWDEEIGDMSRELFERILSQKKGLPEWQVLSIGGIGEPLMHPDICDFIAMARKAGLEVEMISNGILLTPDYADRLIASGLNRLTISIDGFEQDTYEDIRLGSDLPTVLENLRYTAQAARSNEGGKPDLGLEFVMMKRNLADLPKVMDLAVELRIGQVIVTNLLPYSADMKDEILYDGSYAGAPTLAVDMHLRAERYCRFVHGSSMVVAWDGLVSPCYALMHSYSCFIMGRSKQMRRHAFGDAKTQDLAAIWTADDYFRFRGKVKMFDFPSCIDCPVSDGCSLTETNEMDCWTNTPSCSDCLWARNIIRCP